MFVKSFFILMRDTLATVLNPRMILNRTINLLLAMFCFWSNAYPSRGTEVAQISLKNIVEDSECWFHNDLFQIQSEIWLTYMAQPAVTRFSEPSICFLFVFFFNLFYSKQFLLLWKKGNVRWRCPYDLKNPRRCWGRQLCKRTRFSRWNIVELKKCKGDYKSKSS